MMETPSMFALSALSGGFVVMAFSIGVALFWMIVAYRTMRALERMANASEDQSRRVNNRE